MKKLIQLLSLNLFALMLVASCTRNTSFRVDGDSDSGGDNEKSGEHAKLTHNPKAPSLTFEMQLNNVITYLEKEYKAKNISLRSATAILPATEAMFTKDPSLLRMTECIFAFTCIDRSTQKREEHWVTVKMNGLDIRNVKLSGIGFGGGGSINLPISMSLLEANTLKEKAGYADLYTSVTLCNPYSLNYRLMGSAPKGGQFIFKSLGELVCKVDTDTGRVYKELSEYTWGESREP